MTASRLIIQPLYTLGSGPPESLEVAELAFSEADRKLYIGLSDGTIYTFPIGTNQGVAWGQVNGQIEDQTDLKNRFDAIQDQFTALKQVSYTPVVPRVLELNNVAVPTTGQVYQLSAVPSDRPCLAVLQIDPGLAADGGNLALVCEPVSAPQSVPVADVAGVCDALSTYYTSPPFYDRQRARLIIPTASGQVYLARAGNYLTTGSQTKLWTLGYWEGVELNL